MCYDGSMKISKNSKLEKVLSKESTERVLTNPFLHERDDGTKVIYASNKVVVVCIPADDADGDLPGPIPIEAVKASRKHGEEISLVDGYAVVPDGAAYPRDKHLSVYPPVERLLVPADEAVVEIALDAKQLFDLAASMGTEVVKLRIQSTDGVLDPTLPVGVEPYAGVDHIVGARGCILPYKMRRL
jgi:hypothetical protein